MENPMWVISYSGQRVLSALPRGECSPAQRAQHLTRERWGVRQTVCLSHGLNGEYSVARVHTTKQRRLFIACPFQSAISQQLDIAAGNIRQRLGSGPRISSRHVGHAIMGDTFLDINGIEVRCWPRRFRATALIDR